MNIFDLLAQNMEQATIRVPLGVSPVTGEPFGLVCAGVDSPQWAGELDRQRVEGMKFVREHGRIDTDTPEGAAAADKRMQAGKLAQVAAVTVDWFGFTNGTEPAPFDREQLRTILAARSSWVDLAFDRVGAPANFYPTPSAKS